VYAAAESPAEPRVADDARPQPNIIFIFADDWGWGDRNRRWCHDCTGAIIEA